MANVLPLRSAAADSFAATPPTPANPLMVDARRLAALLTVSLRTVRSWDVAGKLPRAVRIGGSVRYSVSEIERWIAAGCPDRKTWEARRAVQK